MLSVETICCCLLKILAIFDFFFIPVKVPHVQYFNCSNDAFRFLCDYLSFSLPSFVSMM